ncbi:hypothetical protein F2Q68_00042372 [Brassica cretica]|uniref:Protein-tyrosine-phosphatase n=1 Tax=Brassica cretica TaxID=69181 RepID=A0A8S9MQI1_BRACR|nr:hypothetical protein F2Q68_00042372 [Brassica cretica]
MAVFAYDEEWENLLDFFDICLDFIDAGRKEKGVLVHCFAGESRSASMVIAYLMRTEKLSCQDALASLKQSAHARPNLGFLKQLDLFERMNFKVDRSSPIYKHFRLKTLGNLYSKDKRFDKLKLRADPRMSNEGSGSTYQCKKCNNVLLFQKQVIVHTPGEADLEFDDMFKNMMGEVHYKNPGDQKKCTSVFVEPLSWMNEEEDPLVWWGECRICQEESAIKNLESPCSCNGSLKYAHRKCVQRWCNEKGNTICEICHQPYQAGYTSPPPPPQSDETTIDIGGGWTISGLDLDDPNLLAIAEAERQILELEYDDYTEPDTTLAAFFRISALILMTLLLRYALTIPDYADGEEEDPSSILSLFLLRAATFLLPCYIMASAINILHQRRQRQEAEALATRFALVLSSRQPRDMVNYLSMEP